MKKNILQFVFLCLLVAVTTTSCKLKAKAYLYTESSIQPSDVHVQTIAILPNRLPATLQDPEKWRVKNYKAIKKILTAKGFNVIDYETSNQMFQQSGLPLEDTKSSRDKYADLAQKLNADLLVFPYYATSFNSTPFSNSYTSIASLQFYSLAQNDFSARVDLEGVDKISTWPGLAIPMLGAFITLIGTLNQEDYASDPQASSGPPSDGPIIFGSVLTMVGPLYNLLILPSEKKAYDKAFARGFKQGFDVYFSRFSPNPSGGNRFSGQNNGGNKSSTPNTGSNTTAPANTGNTNSDTATGKYAKYSVTDLELLKKAAADNGDFKTAAEIKEEIDKRKK